MAKKVKKEKQNPLQREYGVLSNSVYVLKKIKQYSSYLMMLMAIGVFSNTVMRLMWSLISKYVLDIVENQVNSETGGYRALYIMVAIVAVVELAALMLNNYTDSKRWYLYPYVRMKCIGERISKVMTMNYQHLEEPDVLDMEQRASRATGSNTSGIEALMNDVYNLGVRALTLIVTLSAVFVLDWRLVFAIAILNTFSFFFYLHTVKKDRRDVWLPLAPIWRQQNYMRRVTQDFEYAKDIRLFGMKAWLGEKQHEVYKFEVDKMKRCKNLWTYYGICTHTVTVITTAIIYGILILNFLGDELSIGDFTLYISLATTFSTVMTELLNSMGEIKKHSLEVDDFRAFIELEEDDESGCIPLPGVSEENIVREHSEDVTLSYKFEFINVSYRYKGQDGYALKNLNITIEPGTKLAVVGLNGAGKTTMIKLLMRLYDPTEGVILLNGVDIRRYKRRDYFRLFAPLFQQIMVFAFPMNENVSMLTPDKTNKERALSCLIKAGLSEKIASLDKGADTQLLKVIYEDGIDLSGGERQKLGLAKALYKDAPIVVLDEPTAALDALAEYELYQKFDSMIGNKSAVYISHRLSSTRFCDAIAMFVEGEMVEYGSHEELLNKGGAYAEMYNIQAQYYK